MTFFRYPVDVFSFGSGVRCFMDFWSQVSGVRFQVSAIGKQKTDDGLYVLNFDFAQIHTPRRLYQACTFSKYEL